MDWFGLQAEENSNKKKTPEIPIDVNYCSPASSFLLSSLMGLVSIRYSLIECDKR